MKKIFLLVLLVLFIFLLGCAPKTEIREKGFGGAEIFITPSEGKVLEGIVTITLLKVPPETKVVGFSLESMETEGIGETGPNLGFDRDSKEGWSTEVDTTEYTNNKYKLSALAFSEEPGQDTEPTAGSQVEIIVNNPPQAKAEFSRNYPSIIKGNWEPSTQHMSQILDSEVEELKELGVNTVSIVIEYNLNKDGSYFLEDGDEIYINQLKKAKKAGFAVLVSPNFVGALGHNYAEEGINIDLERHLQNSEEVALKWAKIAEEYQVEFFAPQNEFNGPIEGNFATQEEAAKITSDWHKQMLPKLKQVFGGKLMVKLDQPMAGIDVSGYDYVGMTVGHGNGPIEGVRNYLRDSFLILKEIGEKSKAQWLVSEAWFPYGGPWYPATTNEDGLSLDELQDDYYKMSLEEYQKAGGKDYIFIAWLMPGMEIKDRPAEAVIKEYFAKVN